MSEKVVDPWVVQAPKQAEQVPCGPYLSFFKGVEEFTLQSGELKWRFVWEVKSGPEKGKVASALCDRSIRPNTLAGTLIVGLLGRPIVVGENVKEAIDGCKGKSFFVTVQPGPKGGKPGVRFCGEPLPM